jgi:NAD(P)-dependent dehydrogenase (short-subunit alcohol dehydrogenase family)|tara:strand:+ start:120 stop:905 length:786 start_codon:yes stop_codon:yes gene_type:complete
MEKQSNSLFDLSNKFSLITGACGLLGEQHAVALSEINSNLILVDINDKKGLILKKKLVRKYSNKIYYFNCDITKKKQINALRNRIKKYKIKINTLINNASINPQPDHKIINENWENSIDLGLTAAKNIIEIFVKDMIKNKNGNIINIGSDLSVIAPDQRIYGSKKNYKPLSYSVIKHGIVGMTKYYASLYAKNKIRCNCLSPGGVYNKQNKKFTKKLISRIPLGRMAKKDEYKGSIQFLASRASDYMTGQNIVIDGGRSII